MITARQLRAVVADGGQVLDGAGQTVGRVVRVLVDVQTFEPAHVTIACLLCGGAAVVPLAGAALVDGDVHVPHAATDVCGAPQADGAAGRLEPERAREIDWYYARLDRGAAGRPAGDDGRDAGPASAPPWPDVRSDHAGIAAYPSTPDGPWPPVSTSSAGPPWWERRQWRWPSAAISLRAMRLELRPLLELTGLPDDQIEDLILAAVEAAANAVEHAHHPAPPCFDVLTEVGAARTRIVIQDHGSWRPPTGVGDRGRGLQMMHRLADATLTVGPRGTTVVLRNRSGLSG
jgi:anti-sigma regulatory factor (Ser/Thr protein kinase)